MLKFSLLLFLLDVIQVLWIIQSHQFKHFCLIERVLQLCVLAKIEFKLVDLANIIINTLNALEMLALVLNQVHLLASYSLNVYKFY